MFLMNGMKATLRQYNRESNNEYFDDQNFKDVQIKLIPYNADSRINFDTVTTKEATGYYQLPRWVDVQVGDQILFKGKFNEIKDAQFQTVLEVKDNYLFNHVENKIVAIK